MREVAVNPMALQVPEARYTDVFDVPDWAPPILSLLPSHYASGLYLGYIEKERFKPSLPLARKLSAYCGTRLECIIVNEDGEKRFLYGRMLLDHHLVKWTPGIAIVVNTEGEALGWGKGVETHETKMVRPLWDLGWYLRRGG